MLKYANLKFLCDRSVDQKFEWSLSNRFGGIFIRVGNRGLGAADLSDAFVENLATSHQQRQP